MSLMMQAEGGVTAFPDGDNIFQWTGTITGGGGTVCGRVCPLARSVPRLVLPARSLSEALRYCLPFVLCARCIPRADNVPCAPRRACLARQVYEGLTFKLSLKFPTSYPYEAPQVTFITPCFHPNVDQFGNICLDILKVRPASASRHVRSTTRPLLHVPSFWLFLVQSRCTLLGVRREALTDADPHITC